MENDPQIHWSLASSFGIEVDAASDAWHSGHVTDIVKLDDADALVVATETGGAWMVADTSVAVSLSANWDVPDVGALALGPDGNRHLLAGCTRRYFYKPNINVSSPIIMETDAAATAPLLNWAPIAHPLPVDAGMIRRIVIIRNLRRIIVACSKERPGDAGGIYWAVIPPTRFDNTDPPRPPYEWRQAKVDELGQRGFWDVDYASTSNEHDKQYLEDRSTITIVAAGFSGGGLFVGGWDETDELVLKRAKLIGGDQASADLLFNSVGTSSVSSCNVRPRVLYAACALPDGRHFAVLRSRDGGRRWERTPGKIEGGTLITDVLQMRAGEQGRDWNNRIAAHPTNPGMAALGWQAGTFLTLNSGATWRLIEGDPHLHPDVHALLFSPLVAGDEHHLHIGSDGGVVHVNLDDYLGLTGQPFRSNLNRNLPTLQVYSTVIRQFYGTMDASERRPWLIAAGTQDNGNVFTLLPSVEPWRHADTGDGGWNAFLDDDAYARNVMGEAVQVALPPNGMVTFAPPIAMPPDPAGLKGPVAEPVVAPQFQNARGLLLAVAGTSERIYGLFFKSSETVPYWWEQIALLPTGNSVGALCSFDGATVFAGAQTGRMYAIDTASGTTSQQTVSLPKPSPNSRMTGGAFTRIVAFSSTDLFAVLNAASEEPIVPPVVPPIMATPPNISSYVLRLNSSNWSPTPSLGLSGELLFGCVVVDAPQAELPRTLLVSTDDAVYISRDGAETWNPASSGLPRWPHCGDLRYAASTDGGRRIFLGTYGRSVWVASI